MSLLLGLAVAWAQDTVRLSGVIQHTGSGEIRVELLTRQEGSPPLMAWSAILPGAGPFHLDVPAHLGAVTLRAAADPDRDGIGPTDPQVVLPHPIEITRQPVTDIEITLKLPDQPRVPGSGATE